MPGENPKTLAMEYVETVARHKRDGERLAELKKLLPEVMEEEGLESMRLKDGPTVYLSSRLKAWPSGDTEKMHEDLRHMGAGHLVKSKEAVNFNSLCGLVKERLQDGQAVPESIKYEHVLTVNVRSNS